MGEDSILRRRIAGDGVELAVTVAGTGPPVLLLHGFPENSRSWRHQMRALSAAGYSAWAPDLRGYGDSDCPRRRDAYHLRHLMADVAALVAATGYPRAHIVGHDWGGVIAWSFAGQYAHLVETLTIMNAPHLQLYREAMWRSPQLLRSWYVGVLLVPWLAERLLSAADFAAMRATFRVVSGQPQPFSDDDIESYIAPFRRPGTLTAALNYYRANVGRAARGSAGGQVTKSQVRGAAGGQVTNSQVRGAAGGQAANSQVARPDTRVSADTLVLWGDKDPALDTALLNGIERIAPKVRVHRFPDAGHWINNERPAEVNRLLVDFLTNHDRGES